jgi:hypothetical protein
MVRPGTPLPPVVYGLTDIARLVIIATLNESQGTHMVALANTLRHFTQTGPNICHGSHVIGCR